MWRDSPVLWRFIRYWWNRSTFVHLDTQEHFFLNIETKPFPELNQSEPIDYISWLFQKLKISLPKCICCLNLNIDWMPGLDSGVTFLCAHPSRWPPPCDSSTIHRCCVLIKQRHDGKKKWWLRNCCEAMLGIEKKVTLPTAWELLIIGWKSFLISYN